MCTLCPVSTPTLPPAGPCASAVCGRTGQERVSVTDSEEAGQMQGTTGRVTTCNWYTKMCLSYTDKTQYNNAHVSAGSVCELFYNSNGKLA